MAQSIKFNDNNYMDASGVYDSTQNKTQSDINGMCVTKKRYTVPANGSVSIPLNAGAYMISSYSSSASTILLAFGNGYYTGANRHKINEIIPSSVLTLLQSEEYYGVVVSNSSSSSYDVSVYQ